MGFFLWNCFCLENIVKLCHILYFWNLFLLAYFEFDLYSISKVENEGFHGTEDKSLRTDLGFLEIGPADVGYWQSKAVVTVHYTYM